MVRGCVRGGGAFWGARVVGCEAIGCGLGVTGRVLGAGGGRVEVAWVCGGSVGLEEGVGWIWRGSGIKGGGVRVGRGSRGRVGNRGGRRRWEN